MADGLDSSLWKQLLKSEIGQDFCLLEPEFVRDFKDEFEKSTDTTIEALIGDSFQKMNGLVVISNEQKKIIFDYLESYEAPAP